MASTRTTSIASLRGHLLCALLCLPGGVAIPAIALAQDAVNVATIAPPVGVTDPVGGCTGAVPPVCTGNNIATDSDPIVAPQLTLAKLATPSPFVVGVPASYTLTLSNTGTTATTAVATIVDVVPAGLLIGTPPAGCSVAGQTVTCTVPAGLAAGAASAVSFVVPVTAQASIAGTTLSNTATVRGGGDASCPATGAVATRCAPTISTPVDGLPALTLTKTGPASVVAGASFSYVLTLANGGNTTTGSNVVLQDQLPAGVVATAVTGANCGTLPSAAGALLSCTLPAPIAASGSAVVTLVVTAPATAGSIINYAATNPTGTGTPTTPPGPACAAASTACASAPTTVAPAVPVVNFCAANTVFNITQLSGPARGAFYRYTIGGSDVLVPELNLPVPANLNALMVDPVRNRLLFVSYVGTTTTLYAYDAANGGWYVAAPPVSSPDFPRAGMTSTGIGYLVAGNSANPAVWRVTPSGAFNYTLAAFGTLSYDRLPSSLSSGDVAFDVAGNGWLTAGEDVYKIDFSATPLVAVRQQRPLLNGQPSTLAWAGVAFASDGRLVFANNNSPSAYYGLTLSTGVLTQLAPTTANQARDLASCAFPAAPVPAVLRVTKTLGTVNGVAAVAGAPVRPGDVLGYAIRVDHIGGNVAATLFPGDVVETLPASTTVVTAGNDFACVANTCLNTAATNIAVGGTATLNFLVTVNSPLLAGSTAINNAVTVKNVDCTAAGNDCSETTPIGPVVAVTKTGPATAVAGASITYTLVVANSGGTATAGAVTVQDQLPAGVVATSASGATCTPLPSAPGALLDCQVPGPIAAGGSTSFSLVATAPATGGTITNYAATSTTGTGNPPTPPGTACVSNATVSCSSAPSLVELPSLSLLKTAGTPVDINGNGLVDAGDTISYTFAVTNTGNVPLNGVVVNDAKLSATPIACAPATIAGGQVANCGPVVYTITAANVTAGKVDNSATATGTPTGGTPVTSVPSTTSTPTTAAAPALTLVKTAGTPVDVNGNGLVDAGDTISYTFAVSNTGNVPLNGVVINDAKISATPIACTPTNVPVAGSAACGPVVYTITAADVLAGKVDNSATATGTPPGGTPITSVPSTTSTPTTAAAAALSLVKTAGTPVDVNGNGLVDAGDTISYTFAVSNTGNVPLNGVVINDAKLSATPIACTPADVPVSGTAACGPVVYTITAADVLAGKVDNSATATGTPPGGTPVTSVPSTTSTPVTAAAPALTLLKTAGTPVDVNGNGLVDAGDTISYTFAVSNTGNVALNGVVINDAKISATPIACTPADVPVSGTAACGPVVYTITAADVTTGQVDNSATATGTPPGGAPITSVPSTTSTPTAAPAPALTLLKTAGTPVDVNGNGLVDAGDTIAYTFAVTNTGNVALNGVVINDAKLSATPIACTPTNVPVAGTAACGPVVYTITPADVTAGKVDNSATATGTPPGGAPITSVPSTTSTPVTAAAPALILLKTAGTPVDVNGNGLVDAGDTISYTFAVSNTGNVALNGVVIDDAKLSATPIACTPTNVPVNGSAACGPVVYTITAADVLAGKVDNSATATGTPPGGTPITSVPSTTSTPTAAPAPASTLLKTAGIPVDVNGNGLVDAGDTIAYTFAVSNTGNVALNGVVINDAKLSATPIACTPTNVPVAGTAACGPVVYTITAADVLAGKVDNSATATGTPPGGVPVTSVPSTTSTPTAAPAPALTLVKTAGTPVDVNGNGLVDAGDTISYTFAVSNTGNVPLNGVVINDAKLSATPIACTPANVAVNGTAACGPVVYTITAADVLAGKVDNSATATGTPPGGAPITSVPSTTSTPTAAPAPALTLLKTAGLPVDVNGNGITDAGDTIAYTFAVSNTGNVPLNGVVINDAKLSATPIACTPANVPVTGTAACGPVVYTITATDVGAGQVDNTATATGTPPGGTPVTSIPSTTSTPVAAPAPSLSSIKTLTGATDPDGSGGVSVGDVLTFTITATNTGNVPLLDLRISDARITPDSVTCARVLSGAVCVLVGTYVVTPADAQAGVVVNTALITVPQPPGTPQLPPQACPAGSTDPTCAPTTSVPVSQRPAIAATKTATLTTDNGTPGVGNVGDVITYTVTATNTGNVALEQVTVRDTFQGGAPTTLSCAPTTLQPGATATCASYTHTITAAETNAGTTLANTVTASGQSSGAQPTVVTASAAANITVQPDATTIRVSKRANPGEVKVGDLVRYTVIVQNTGTADLVDGSLVDTPPPGFSFVAESLQVADGDNAGRLVGTAPIRVDQLDIVGGGQATISYLLRVGAGVRPGVYRNSAYVQDDGATVSNVATADVRLASDPLLDESLLLGTVFDDRDGDGWQDSAGIDGAVATGGFAPGVYVPNSSRLLRGDEATPLADASAPLLHGVALGSIVARQSDADLAADHALVISQVLTAATFTDDFVLTTRQGVAVHMDAAGNTRTTRDSGDARKGLTGAEPTVVRSVAPVDGGFRVDYTIANNGVDERGIPGVRVASVDGLLMETDQYGRYHLAGVKGGPWERGRNVIMKVDPVTVPPGSTFTTPNPLVRRVTPGLPTRFDFGVRLPSGLLEAPPQVVEMTIGEVLFAPGSAELRAQVMPAIDGMAAQVRSHGAGEVLIAADGQTQDLAYARAKAVRDALLSRLTVAQGAALSVSLRADVDAPDSTLLSLGSEVLLGTLLFDTDSDVIRAQYVPLIAQLAKDLDAASAKGMPGLVVDVVGHADSRGSAAHNQALGLRRAQAVQRAIAAQQSPAARALLRVDAKPSTGAVR